MINKVSNIDTICILLDIEDYENSSKEILEYLQLEKEKAKLGATNSANYKHLIALNELAFELLANGTTGYSYILRNNSYEVKIANFRSSIEGFYPIQLRISSESLWSDGITNSWGLIYNWITESFGNIIDNKVCRVDLCCHVSDVDFIIGYEESYKGTYKKTNNFTTNRNINSITFGSRKSKKIYCRIYNKTLEIQETNQKLWFREIWKNNNMNISNVWNVEFEIKSELLRKFNIISMNDLLAHIRDLWEYCTKEWLVKIDRTNARVERCDICKDWIDIQEAYNHYSYNGLILKEKQLEYDANALIPNIVGNITSYSARKGTIYIEQAFNNLYKDAQRYLHKKDTDFTDAVLAKKKLMGKKEVHLE